MITAFILFDLFENFRKLKQQTEREALNNINFYDFQVSLGMDSLVWLLVPTLATRWSWCLLWTGSPVILPQRKLPGSWSFVTQCMYQHYPNFYNIFDVELVINQDNLCRNKYKEPGCIIILRIKWLKKICLPCWK